MLIFKFGGASVKSADAVKNVGNILGKYPDDQIAIVISAMGKTTNALEVVTDHYFHRKIKEMKKSVDEVRAYHMGIAEKLFKDPEDSIFKEVEDLFEEIKLRLSKPHTLNYDFDYDQIVSYGEILSTVIISAWLNNSGIENRWMDIRKYLKSDNNYREGRIDWELSTRLIRHAFHFRDTRLYITQGFIATTIDDMTTTLGREGSDFTAAILAHILKADSVTIWKDVPGVLNADPKWFDDTVRLEKISYLDAIELAYYGATVIHPKTIKPLQNKNINLYVKSFLEPEKEGTLVGNLNYEKLVPSFIFKMHQVLIRISPVDFSFIAENNLQVIFGYLSKYGIRINLMQNSAVSFQICLTNNKKKVRDFIDDLEQDFRVSYETGLELITIRYYDQSTIDRVMINKELILEQRYKQNIQLVVRDLG